MLPGMSGLDLCAKLRTPATGHRSSCSRPAAASTTRRTPWTPGPTTPGQTVLIRRAGRPAAGPAAPGRTGAARPSSTAGDLAPRPGRPPGLAGRTRRFRPTPRQFALLEFSMRRRPGERAVRRPRSSTTSGTSPTTATPTSSTSASSAAGSTSRSDGPACRPSGASDTGSTRRRLTCRRGTAGAPCGSGRHWPQW